MHQRKTPSRYGLIYQRGFITPKDRKEILEWISTVYPIWEERYSTHHPPPPGENQRRLLRPVYWLGNWQFACLNYFHPPKNIFNCCVKAEPFPPILARLIDKVQGMVRARFKPTDIPKGWNLNTCLVNFYGSQINAEGKRNDVARVGEHKDFEPGPVASISLGDRALFQFVSSRSRGTRDSVVLQQWLEDGSLQIFGGNRYKSQLFHRVQRVENKRAEVLPTPGIHDFETRRINFTFRYVPEQYIVPFSKLPQTDAEDIRPYVELLARHSSFFKKILD